VSADHRQLKHSMEVHRQLLESRADATVFLQPADALLDYVPLPVRLLVELHATIPPRCLAVLVRDHWTDALFLQPITHAFHAVALVAGQFPRLAAPSSSLASPSDPACDGLTNHRFGLRRFMHLAGGHFDRQRRARTVSD